MKTHNETWRRAIDRWGWLCPTAMILAAAAILRVWGLSWWTAIVVALLLACPVLLVWGAIVIRRRRREGGNW